ncbi:phosphate signaling complex protein PhoU [Candidatus Sumerlaeota bacterium]|nr:phosphate signaling complex protein PhoU [Candidatus Sumerlaeota bacterium]
MTQVFFRDIARLKGRVLALGEIVERAVEDGVRSVETRDEALAGRVIEGDRRIDEMEIEIEEECLKILALHQPVAQDLRFLVAVLKMNNDLERIGDKAAGLARKACRLGALPRPEIAVDHGTMAEKTLAMLLDSLRSLLDRDRDLAVRVCTSDDEINALEDEHTRALRTFVSAHPAHAEACGLLIEVSSALERIADLATNIAEDVIYMIDGTIVRHHHLEGENEE